MAVTSWHDARRERDRKAEEGQHTVIADETKGAGGTELAQVDTALAGSAVGLCDT
jgi:hypothetical protein